VLNRSSDVLRMKKKNPKNNKTKGWAICCARACLRELKAA